MDRIYDELDEVKVEVEKLREECRTKTELSTSLRKAHVEQVAKIQEAKLETDKLAQELNAKSEEICEIRQMYDELQSSLHRKDLSLQQISSANEKLRSEYGEKILKLEGENRGLVSALDEASTRIEDLEKKTSASSEEIASLKRLMSIKPEKSLEIQKNASKDLKERDEYVLKLEEENRITQDQLKWKNEQFSHLEEAHEKLQSEFHASKVEWQTEESSLIGEISSLQDKLDVQVRVSESLESQLRMSNHALAHEESRRKVLEIELSEYRSQFVNVFQECQVVKSEIEQLTIKRDEEIAELRTLVRKKGILTNEMKYRTAQLEQENSDLLASLKDIQESHINNNVSSSSLKKLRNKLQGLEQLHNRCGMNLKEEEAKWNSQMDGKNRSIRELHKELENCRCLLEVKNEEIFYLVMVLKSEFYVAYSKIYDAKEKVEMGVTEIEEKNMLLNQQLQSKITELQETRSELKQRCDEIAVLMERVESLDSFKEKENLMEEEIRRYKAMLEESDEGQHCLKQQFLELENTQKEKIKNALEMVNRELAKRTSEVEQSEFELQKLKSEVEILKFNLEENQQANKQEHASFLVVVNDKDAEIGKLQEQICVLESEILSKSEAAEVLNQEKNNYMQIAEDRKCRVEILQNEIAQLKNQLAETEAASVALQQENARFSAHIKEREQKIQELQKEVESLDQDFKNAMVSFTEKEGMLDEALKAAEDQKVSEIEEKNQIIAKLEKEVNILSNEVEFQEKSWVEAKKVALQLEDSLQTKESNKQELLEDLKKASNDRENLVAQLEVICRQIGVFGKEDVELMNMLEKISHLSEADCELGRNREDGLGVVTFSPSRKFTEVNLDGRTPLTELNC